MLKAYGEDQFAISTFLIFGRVLSVLTQKAASKHIITLDMFKAAGSDFENIEPPTSEAMYFC